MKSESNRRLFVLVLLTLVVLAGQVTQVQSQSAGHLTMTITGQSLTAGFNNNVTIQLVNSHYSAIYDTDLVVSLPTPLNLIGDDHWHYNSIALGKMVTISFQVYAPTSAIGSSYQGSISASYKQLGDVSATEESHVLGFSVYGWINLVLYSISLLPTSAVPGGNTTISGNLLNSGNLAAYNTNVSVASNATSKTSSSFIGEVDPNIPRPFSLQVFFKSNLPEGNYSVTITVAALDDSRPDAPIVTQREVQIQIKKATQQQTAPPTQQPTDALSLTLQIMRSIPVPLPIVITGLAVGSVMKNSDRRISKKRLGFTSVLAGVLNSGESYLLANFVPQQNIPPGVAGMTAAAARQSYDLPTLISATLVGALIPLIILGIGMLYSRERRIEEDVESHDLELETVREE